MSGYLTRDRLAALTEQVTRQLTQLLSLRSCSFQYGAALATSHPVDQS